MNTNCIFIPFLHVFEIIKEAILHVFEINCKFFYFFSRENAARGDALIVVRHPSLFIVD